MCLSSCYFFSDNKKASHVIVLLVLVCIYFLVNLQLFYMRSILFFFLFQPDVYFLRQGGLARLFYGQYGSSANTKVTFMVRRHWAKP